MNDFEDDLLPAQSDAKRERGQSNELPDDTFLGRAPDIPQSEPRYKGPSDLFDVDDDDAKLPPLHNQGGAGGQESDWQDVDHSDAKTDREWAARKKQLGFAREAPGGFRGAVKKGVGAIGNAVTRIGAAGAQDSYTAGKVLGGIGGAAKGVIDTTKDLSKIGQGVDKIAGLKGENSILQQNIPYLGFNMNTIAKAELAPGIKVADTAKAALQDGGTLLEVAGRGITAASGREALDFGDEQRRKYMNKRDVFKAKQEEVRSRLGQGQRAAPGELSGTTQAAVRQATSAVDLGKAVNEYGIRPEYEYSMKESADANNMKVKRTAHARRVPNPSSDPGDPQAMEIAPGEVTFERNAGTDALNTVPDYQTREELAAGRRAKRLAAPGEAVAGLGRILDGSEHGQEAVRKGEYLKGAAQATLSGARTVGKGMATAAATPLGLGLATSALVDVGTVAAGGLLQAVGGGINAATGVGAKADAQRAIELRNRHYFGQAHFLKEANDKGNIPANAGEEEAKQEAEAPEQRDAVPNDPYFDSARGRRIAERGLRIRDPLKNGDYEKGDRDAGLPDIDHGGKFKNFWHNRMKRPLKKVGQGLLKPISLVAKGVGYLTGAIPLYKYFQNKKRTRAIEAATNRVNNRRGGRLNDQTTDDGFELVNNYLKTDQQQEPVNAEANRQDEKEPATSAQYAGPENQDKVLQSLEGRQADADLNRIELRGVLQRQNESYTSSTKSRAAEAALKMGGRDLTKENVAAWQNFERKHNLKRLAEMIADRKRERAKDPVTGESFLERQKREYAEWRQRKNEEKARDPYAEASMANAMQHIAATDPHANPPAKGEDKEPAEDEGSLDGELSSRGSGEVDGDPLSAAQEVLRNRPKPGRRFDELATRARNSGPLGAITEADDEEPDAEEVVNDAGTGAIGDAASSQVSSDEEIKQPEAPQSSAAAQWFETVPGLGPIQNDAPQEEKVPLGYTPEGWAEEKRAWEKLRKK